MNAIALQSFGFEGNTVRALDKAGAPWFVAQDVCGCLEIVNHSHALAALDDDEKGVHTVDTLGGAQRVAIIAESGMYALIFKSRKPAARRFRKWVTAEVLPTIRRTGQFVLPGNDSEGLPAERPANDAAAMMDYTPALSVIREARQTFGRAAAQRLWGRLGLPDVVDRPGPAALCAVPVTIADWMQQCTSVDMKTVETAAALYASYRAWCDDMDAKAETQTKFGTTLERMGYVRRANHSTGLVERIGLKLLT